VQEFMMVPQKQQFAVRQNAKNQLRMPKSKNLAFCEDAGFFCKCNSLDFKLKEEQFESEKVF